MRHIREMEGVVTKNPGRISMNAIAKVLMAATGLALASSANAATIISDNFSIGYGWLNNSWNTTETASVNTGPGSNFLLNLSFATNGFSNTGPSFTNRVLGTVTSSGYVSISTTFSTTLTATYTGPAPLDAAALPNYRLQLNITGISLYVAPSTIQAGQTANFRETTVGNTQAQSAQPVSATGNFTTLASYVNLVWDPNDFQSAGQSQARTFSLETVSPTALGADGFQVFGNIVLTYDAVPEPATFGLLGAAALVGICLRRRSRT